MNKVNKSFLLQLIIVVFLVGGTVAWAWINPTANPPGGGGAISVNSSGNVGIGTTGPAKQLDLTKTGAGSAAEFQLTVDSGLGGMSMYDTAFAAPYAHFADRISFYAGTTASGLDLRADAVAGDMRFYTGGLATTNERVRITSAGNVGIGTTSPGAKLEVVGATKFGGLVDVVLNRIINVGNPTAGTDAVNKDYVDLKGAVGGASTRLWGEGRPNVGLKDNGTSCTNTVGGQTIKLARSDHIAYWDNASAVCPVGWWVCSAAERGTVDCSAAYTTNSHWIRCYANDLSNEYRTSDGSGAEDEPNTNEAWVSDARVMGADPAVILRAPTVGRNGIANSEFLCSILPTWCCANQ